MHYSVEVLFFTQCLVCVFLQAEESYMADEANQGNTLVSVAPLNPPESQEKPSQNGESLEVKIQSPPAATNGHSTTKADTELWDSGSKLTTTSLQTTLRALQNQHTAFYFSLYLSIINIVKVIAQIILVTDIIM